MDGVYKPRRELQNYLGSIPNNLWASGNHNFGGFSDSSLYLPTRDELERFLRENAVNDADDFDEGFDCDDYSFVLKGRAAIFGRRRLGLQHSMCLGITWGYFGWVQDGKAFHCCNWVIENDKNFLWIEPQDGSFHRLDECAGGLTLMLV